MSLNREMVQQGQWLFRYRSYLPLVLLLGGLAVSYVEPNRWQGFSLDMLALVVGLAGLVIRMHVVGHAPKNTSGRNTAEGQVADQLNTTGWYSLVRHPLYVGNFLMWLSPALMVGQPWFIGCFALVFALYYERIMMAEEAYLTGKFGAVYLQWAGKTPAFFPKWTGYVPTGVAVSWKKILRKEKNGLFALALVNYLLEQWQMGWKDGSWFVHPWTFWGYSTVVGLGVYVVLKFLKYQTRWLADDRG